MATRTRAPQWTANQVAADEKRRRHAVATRRPTRPDRDAMGTIPTWLRNEQRLRKHLLEQARQGDPVAVRLLRDRYHCWLVPDPVAKGGANVPSSGRS